MKDLACLNRAPLLTPSYTMDVSEDPNLVQQLDSTQEETATHDPVEEDHSSVIFVVGDKFSSYSVSCQLSTSTYTRSILINGGDLRKLNFSTA